MTETFDLSCGKKVLLYVDIKEFKLCPSEI